MKKLKPNTYEILNECIENGINWGWDKAYDVEAPSEEFVKEKIRQHIMILISEKFIF